MVQLLEQQNSTALAQSPMADGSLYIPIVGCVLLALMLIFLALSLRRHLQGSDIRQIRFLKYSFKSIWSEQLGSCEIIQRGFIYSFVQDPAMARGSDVEGLRIAKEEAVPGDVSTQLSDFVSASRGLRPQELEYQALLALYTDQLLAHTRVTNRRRDMTVEDDEIFLNAVRKDSRSPTRVKGLEERRHTISQSSRSGSRNSRSSVTSSGSRPGGISLMAQLKTDLNHGGRRGAIV